MGSLVSIAEGIKTKKGSIIATVVKASDLKEGEGKTGKYIMQRFTLKDESGEITLTAWNEETNLLQLGSKYEIAPWWQDEYEGKPQIGLGKFGKVKLLEAGQKQEAIPEATPETTAIPDLEASIKGIVHTKTMELLMIEKEVRATLQANNPREAENGQKIGMFTRTIFNHLNNKGVTPY